MTSHRFQEQLRDTFRQPVSTGLMPSSFVQCPVFALLPISHQAQVQEIYRVAAELTREQLAPSRRRVPAFSAN